MQPKSPLDQFYTRIGNALYDQRVGVNLQERAFLQHVNLRGNPKDAQFLSDSAAVLGVELPLEPNTWAGSDATRVCWLGPNEWLLIADEGQECLGAALRSKHVGAHRFFSVSILSGGQTVLRLSGERIRDLFSKGSTLDFHPRQFKQRRCAQSTLAKATALYIQLDDQPPSYDIVVRRSFSDYISLWLEDAAYEFGLCVIR